jgi:hypothetical protein
MSFVEAFSNKLEVFMSLADVKEDGSWLRTYDENGRQIAVMSKNNMELSGIGSEFFVCLDGSWIRTYDSNCKQIAVMSANNMQIKSAAGQNFTCKDGSWIRTYDKNCKQVNVRSA